ncbi:hypothetical protein HPB51_028787 [Rhipicephalus microplus]|uniref:Transmembrane protein n=1 Tax=Rhipicephalus microplus TaxID=6941 RepID=A0A9J6CWN3_RHIMP|nr:hypothetical protein HPB51_028787 [Rhipicephalus microplus]
MHGLEMAEAPKPEKLKPALAAKPSYTVTNLDTLFDDNLEGAGQAVKVAEVSDMFPNAPFANQRRLKRDDKIARQRRVNLMIGAAILLIAVIFLATLGASLFMKEVSSPQPTTTAPPNVTVNIDNVDSEDTGNDAKARIESDEDSGSRATAQPHTVSPVPLEDEETVQAAEDHVGSPAKHYDTEDADDASTTGHSSMNGTFESRFAYE